MGLYYLVSVNGEMSIINDVVMIFPISVGVPMDGVRLKSFSSVYIA